MKIFLYLWLLLPIGAFAQGGLPTQPYIYVEGKAELEKPADMVTLRFEVVGRQADEKKANADVQGKANAVFQLAKSRGIAIDDILSESLRSEPQFENSKSYQKKGKVIGYAVSRPFSIKVRDVASFPKLVDDIIAIGGVEFSAIEGGLQKEHEVRQDLWTKAIANAREQAEKTVKPMGMNIDSVFAISPVPVAQITSTMFPKDTAEADRGGVAGYAEQEARTEQAIRTPPSQYHVAPITITQIVHVIYLISAPK
jgi:uncharacterized protein YggE